MERIQLQIDITLDEETVASLARLIQKVAPGKSVEEEKKEARLRASQNASFSGQEPPKDRGLLINSREAAKLLGVSERTLGKCGTKERCRRRSEWGKPFDGVTKNSEHGFQRDAQRAGIGRRRRSDRSGRDGNRTAPSAFCLTSRKRLHHPLVFPLNNSYQQPCEGSNCCITRCLIADHGHSDTVLFSGSSPTLLPFDPRQLSTHPKEKTTRLGDDRQCGRITLGGSPFDYVRNHVH